MLWFIRAVTLLSQGVILQLMQIFGWVGVIVGLALGFFRAPWWSVLIGSLVLGVGVDWMPQGGFWLMEKATTSSERGGYLVLVYFVILTATYVLSRYGRYLLDKRRAGAAKNEA